MHSLSIGDTGHLWAPLVHHPAWWIGGLLVPLALMVGWLTVWLAFYPGSPFRHHPLCETAPPPPGWAVVAYVVSALWRHPHVHGGVLYRGYFSAVLVTGLGVMTVVPWLGLIWIATWGMGGALAMSWEAVARALSYRRGFRVLYVLPSPPRWVARRLRALGFAGPVAAHLWEMHVNESIRWRRGGHVREAVSRFREAYTADRIRWLRERPDYVGLVICTFNRLPEAELAALQAAGAWVFAGPLHPRIPQVVTPRRQRTTQRRMFGRVVSDRDRTDPAGWTTVYVPPRKNH